MECKGNCFKLVIAIFIQKIIKTKKVIILNEKLAVVSGLWKQMPPSLTNTLGPYLSKWLP